MEITKREVITSVIIIAVMLTIGFVISDKISDYQNNQNAKYQKAVQIQDAELFQYGMDTSVGNAFVYGKLKAIDTVTFDDIDGEFMHIEKVKEKYTMHTRTVTYKVGKTTKTRVETYWTWDYAGSEEKTSEEVMFCGAKFKTGKIDIPEDEYLDMQKESSHIRYKYYGIDVEHKGTIFTKLDKGTISDGSPFYEGKTIKETIETLTSGGAETIFWIIWIILTACVTFGFYYLDNRWLNE